MLKLIVLLSLLLACAPDEHEKDPHDLSLEERVEHYEDRLLAAHILSQSYPVTRNELGGTEHEGEGILWWGVAQWSLPTEKAKQLWPGILTMLEETKGGLLRVMPLGEYEGGREITFDGAVGFYLGVTAAVVLHGGADVWREPFRQHLTYLKNHEGLLHENTTEVMPPGFDRVRDLLAVRLGLGGSAPLAGLRALEVAAPGFATAGRKRGVCYPTNLAYLTFLGLRVLGEEPSSGGRNAFCIATDGFGVPTVEHYCGRAHIRDFVASFRENEWEFRHQRCGDIETPDGRGDRGWQTPALDFLMGAKLGFEEQ